MKKNDLFYNEEDYLTQSKSLRKELESFLSTFPSEPKISNKVNDLAERSDVTSIVLGYLFRSIKNKKKNRSLYEMTKQLLIYREIYEFQKGCEMQHHSKVVEQEGNKENGN